jgi:hypothetical protein
MMSQENVEIARTRARGAALATLAAVFAGLLVTGIPRAQSEMSPAVPRFVFTHGPAYSRASHRTFVTDVGTGAFVSVPVAIDWRGRVRWVGRTGSFDTQILSNATVLTYDSGAAQFDVRTLSGRLLRDLPSVGRGYTDYHDIASLGHDGYIVAKKFPIHDVHGYGPECTGIIGTKLQEFDRQGRLRWDWSSLGHIPPAATGRWLPRAQARRGQAPLAAGVEAKGLCDVLHWNAVEPDGGNLILSFRHTDSIFAISRRTGRVRWKLGGTPSPKSLRVIGDPHGHYPLGGAHDPRLLGSRRNLLSIYDDATNLNRPPRAVFYRLDLRHRVARFVGQIREPTVQVAGCCGSVRRLGHNWLIGWGATGKGRSARAAVGEYTPSGRRVWLAEWHGWGFEYRATPVPASIRSQDWNVRTGLGVVGPRRAGHPR